MTNTAHSTHRPSPARGRVDRPDRVIGVAVFVSTVAFTRPSFLPGNVTLAIALVSILLALMSKPASTLRVSAPAVLLVLFGVASASWSENGPKTLSLAALFVSFVLAASVHASRLPLDQFARAVRVGLRACVVSSVALAVLVPGLGTESGGATVGSWVGIYPTRNVLAYVCSLALALELFLPRTSRARQFLFASAAFGSVVLSGSATSLAVCVALMLTAAIFKRLRRLEVAESRRVAAALTTWAIAALLSGWIALGWVVSLLGRDLTFSGRTDIWTASSILWDEKPLVGWGYGTAFDPGTTSGSVFYSVVGWNPTGSHNGLLTVAVQLGLVGLVLAIWLLAATAVRVVRLAHASAYRRVWPLATFGVLFVNDLVENRAFTAVGLYLVTAISIFTRRDALPASTPANNKTLRVP